MNGNLKKLLFGKRLIIIVGILLTVVAAPLGILTMHQYMDAEATTETVDYETLKGLIEPNRDKDPVKLSDNDKLAIPTDPDDGITYQLQSVHLDTTTGGITTVAEGDVQLRLPVMDAHDDKAVLGDNDMIIYRGTTYDIAVDASEEGFSSYIVVLNENAPTDYEFEVELPSGYKLSEDGSNGIEILDEENEIIGKMSAPWAVDADGDEIATVYKLRGDRLVQTLSHSGAAYPVVADPSFNLGVGIYVRWGLDGNDDPEDVIDKVGDWNDEFAYWNCEVWKGTLGAVSLYMIQGLPAITSSQAGVLFGLNVVFDGIFCSDVYGDRDDVNDALDDVEDAMPDAINPWTGEMEEDCTLMARHYYGGFMINKLQLEDCADATGIYYD